MLISPVEQLFKSYKAGSQSDLKRYSISLNNPTCISILVLLRYLHVSKICLIMPGHYWTEIKMLRAVEILESRMRQDDVINAICNPLTFIELLSRD